MAKLGENSWQQNCIQTTPFKLAAEPEWTGGARASIDNSVRNSIQGHYDNLDTEHLADFNPGLAVVPFFYHGGK